LAGAQGFLVMDLNRLTKPLIKRLQQSLANAAKNVVAELIAANGAGPPLEWPANAWAVSGRFSIWVADTDL
jgi:hypothetical protein